MAAARALNKARGLATAREAFHAMQKLQGLKCCLLNFQRHF